MTRFTQLASLTLFALAPLACQATAPNFGHASLQVRPAVGQGRQLLAAPYVKANIHHVVVKLYNQSLGGGLVATEDVAASDLDQFVTFGNLKHATTYRIVTDAYLDAAEQTLISDPAASTIDVVTDASFNHPTLATVPVKLLDGTAAGGSVEGDLAGLEVLEGGIAMTRSGQTITLIGNIADPTSGAMAASTTAFAAKLATPSGVAASDNDLVYVADTAHNSIRRYTPNSSAAFANFAGSATGVSGATDASGASARFKAPEGLAIGRFDLIHVADTGNHCIRTIGTAGAVSTLAGSIAAPAAGSSDGTGAGASFNAPRGVAADRAGNVYVADTGNHCIRKITSAGAVSTLAGDLALHTAGHADGTGVDAKFNAPAGVAVDAKGNVYVADTGNHCIRKVTPAGLVTTLAGNLATHSAGNSDGTGVGASFDSPVGIAVDPVGRLYVSDTNNHCIRMVTPAGTVSTIAGNLVTHAAAASDGTGTAAGFNAPRGLCLSVGGNLLVADGGNHCIRMVF